MGTLRRLDIQLKANFVSSETFVPGLIDVRIYGYGTEERFKCRAVLEIPRLCLRLESNAWRTIVYGKVLEMPI